MPGLSEEAGPAPAGPRFSGGVSTEAGPAPSGSAGGLSVTSTAGKSGGQVGRKGNGVSTLPKAKAASDGSPVGSGVSTAKSRTSGRSSSSSGKGK